MAMFSRDSEVVRLFKGGNWVHSKQIAAFMQAAGAMVPASDMTKLLDIINSKAGTSEPSAAVRNRITAFKTLVTRMPDPALFKPVCKALKSKHANVRAMAIEMLPQVNNNAQHADLCHHLRNGDPQIRAAAGKVLMQVAEKGAYDIIRAYMRESNFKGRKEAMDIVVKVAGHYAIPALGDVLKLGSSNEKAYALRFLADQRFVQGDPRGAIMAVREAFEDKDPRVIQTAMNTFQQLCTEEEWFEVMGPSLESTNLETVKGALQGLKRFKSLRAIRAMERVFRGGPNSIRMSVLASVLEIGDDTVLPLLVEGLNHRHVNVRNKAAEVLTQLSTEGKVEVGRTIIYLLRSNDANVRRTAIDIANRVGSRAAAIWPQLLAFLRDEDWWVRERVMDALVDMAGTELTAHMVSYLSDPSDVVRRYAVGVMMRLKDPNSLGALCRTAMEDPDWWVRELAVQAMGELGDRRAVPYIVNLLMNENEMRYVCLEALEQLKAVEAAAHVGALLPQIAQANDIDLAMAIITCLEKLEDRQQAGYVAQLQNHPDYRLRTQVRDLLISWNISHGNFNSSTALNQDISPLDQLLLQAHGAEGDDLIVSANRQAHIKKRGAVVPLSPHVYSAQEMQEMIFPNLTSAQLDDLSKLQDVDLSHEVKTHGLRFRANIFQQQAGLAAVFRAVTDNIPDIETLGLPTIVRNFGKHKDGLVLVGGPTGSGKSTTLAAIIDDINQNSAVHIITLEDPIEVVHKPKKSLVVQREIGTHSRAYSAALRATLREDPDVILVGEMRDLTTISFAISAAETGHLVFGTVHTVSVDTSIDRMINTFPSGQQPQVRSMLASSLRAVVCQHLMPRKDGEGRVLAVEVMLNTDAVSALIRKGKTFQIPSVLATSREQGMQSMDLELTRLYREDKISEEVAYMKAQNKAEMESLFKEVEAERAAQKTMATPPNLEGGFPSQQPAASGAPKPGLASRPASGLAARPGQPAQSQPNYGRPAGAPGQPVQGQPVQGQPVYGQPVQGQPAPGQPVYGQPAGQGQEPDPPPLPLDALTALN